MQDRVKVIEIVFVSLEETGVLLCLATYVMMSHASSDYADYHANKDILVGAVHVNSLLESCINQNMDLNWSMLCM